MEKALWTSLATIWVLVWSTAVFGGPITDPPIVSQQALIMPNAPTVPVTDLNVTATVQHPTYVLGAANRPEAVGLVLGALLGLGGVLKRRPI